MSAISLKSITGITSITTPSGVDNQLTLHTNDTTQRVKVTQSGIEVVGVATFQDIDVDGHTNLDNISVAGVSTFSSNITLPNNISMFFGDGGTKIFGTAGGGASNGLRFFTDSGGSLFIDGNHNVYVQQGNLSVTGTISATSTVYIPDAIEHSGDSNTKIRFPSADTITFETAGSERARFTKDGNLFIGSNVSQFYPYDSFTNDALLMVCGDLPTINGAGQATILTKAAYNASDRRAILSFGGDYQTNSLGSKTFLAGIGGEKENTTNANFAGALMLYTRPHGGNETERLRIHSDGHSEFKGDVSIKNPGGVSLFSLIDASNDSTHEFGTPGNGDLRITVDKNDIATGPEFQLYMRGNDTADLAFHIDHDRNVKIPNGNLGIGEASPTKALVIAKDSAASIIELKRTNTNSGGSFGAISWTATDGHSVANMYALSDGDNEGAHLLFRTTSAAASNDPYNAATVERLRITSTGFVGVGTATVGRGPLELSRSDTADVQIHMTNAKTGGGTGKGFTIFGCNASAGDAGFVNRHAGGAIEFYTNQGGTIAERLRISSDGATKVCHNGGAFGVGGDPINKFGITASDNNFFGLHRSNASTGTGEFNINVEVNSQVTFSMDDEGAFSFGTSTDPSAQSGYSEKLRIASDGVITAQKSAIFGNTSDSFTALNITASTTGISELRFADTTANPGYIKYTHSNDIMEFVVGTNNQLYLYGSAKEARFSGYVVAQSTGPGGSATPSFGATQSGMSASSYNYILSGSNDVGNKAVMFVNGSTRSADGGVNTLTFRNDAGNLRLGNSGTSTNILGNLTIEQPIVNQQTKFQYSNSGGVGAYLSLFNLGTATGSTTGIVFGIGTSGAVLDGTDYGEGQIKVYNDSGGYGNMEFNLHVNANRSFMKIVGNGQAYDGASAGSEGMRGGVAFGNAGIAIDRSWMGQPGIHVFNQNTEGDTDQGTFRFHGWNRSYASYPNSSGADFSVNLVADGSGLSSDERRKTGIATITNALDTITKMRGVSFQFVNRELDPQTHMSMDNGKKLGFIAQEVIPLLPQLILDSGEKNVPLENGWCDRYSMDYAGVTAVLVEAIKELKAKNGALEARIAALESS